MEGSDPVRGSRPYEAPALADLGSVHDVTLAPGPKDRDFSDAPNGQAQVGLPPVGGS